VGGTSKSSGRELLKEVQLDGDRAAEFFDVRYPIPDDVWRQRQNTGAIPSQARLDRGGAFAVRVLKSGK
jgi:hypothetical protein